MENPYLDPSRIRAALRALELRPTRGMGQNFLIDPVALDAIVSAAELTTGDTVVEVGPGLGVLTWELLRRVGHVVAVELDKRLAARLHEEFGQSPRLRVVQADILNVVPGQLLADDGRLTTDDRPLAEDRQPRSSLLAPLHPLTRSPAHPLTPTRSWQTCPMRSPRRRCATFWRPSTSRARWSCWCSGRSRSGSRRGLGDLSVLAHSVQIYAEPEIVARVPSSSFFPEPAVDSAVLRLRLRSHPAIDVGDVHELMRVIKAGFLHARKKLSNALPSGLASIGMRLEKEQVIAALEDAGVDPGRRAETLTLEEWAAVYL